MAKLKVALVQMKSEKGEINNNLKTFEKYTKESSQQGCEIICFPEMSITGYINPFEMSEAILTLQSAAIKQIMDLSRRYKIIIIAGFVEKSSKEKPYITQIAVKDGEIICVYRKVNIADDEKEWFLPGSELGIFTHNGIQIGLTVCADIDKESLFTKYAKSGVQLIFESAAPGLYGEQATRNWESGFNWWKGECYEKLGRYAKENKIYIAVSTAAGRTIDEDFPGGGYFFSPDGQCLNETKDWSEGILFGEMQI